MSVPETIAQQLDNTRPDVIKPGRDAGMVPLPDALGVYIGPRDRLAVVAYDAGMDEYDVAVIEAPPVRTVAIVTEELGRLLESLRTNAEVADAKMYRGVHCDQIGEFVWGDDAKPYTLPMVMTSWDDGETWDVIA